MRSLLTLMACLMLVVTVWGGSAQAAQLGCSEMVEQAAVHIAGNCDEVPADADKNYPHCHTSCHGHHVAAPVPDYASTPVVAVTRVYLSAGPSTLTARQPDRTLRPPQA